ncbi:MAG: phage integrase SAM-like domain-containing protein [Alistipes sp.]|nr:phage integrase SAM-like domain-containing protein [Alistipes sp.]
MATIYYSLSRKTIGEKQQVYVRFAHGKIGQRAKTSIFVNPKYWDEKEGRIIIPKIRAISAELQRVVEELRAAQEKLDALSKEILEKFFADPNVVDGWLKSVVEKDSTPSVEAMAFFDVWDLFIRTKNVGSGRKNSYRSLVNILKRFEAVKRERNKNFALSLDTFSPLLLEEVEDFLRNEPSYVAKYPHLYKSICDAEVRCSRSGNSTNLRLSMLRAFFRWSVNRGLTENNPFNHYSIKQSVFGTPIYISKEERDELLKFPMPTESLAVVRDIFVFQCCIGCRVGDLLKLKKANVIDGAIEYIAGKTADNRPLTVRVPLNSVALGILDRYKEFKGDKLLPFISSQKYNDYIKKCFKVAGITRFVTTLDKHTGKPIQIPICDIASSHMARRAFVGNLYRQVQDPNLISALSGHTEGSKAFARYRAIDEDLKRKTVKLLE